MDHIPQDQLGDRRSKIRDTRASIAARKTSTNKSICYTIKAADVSPLGRVQSAAFAKCSVVIDGETAMSVSISDRNPSIFPSHQCRKQVDRIESNLSDATSLSSAHLATRVSMVSPVSMSTFTMTDVRLPEKPLTLWTFFQTSIRFDTRTSRRQCTAR